MIKKYMTLFSNRFGSIDKFSQQSNPKTAFPLQKCPKDWERVKDERKADDIMCRLLVYSALKSKKTRFCKIIEVLKISDTYFTHLIEQKPTETRFLSSTLLRKF